MSASRVRVFISSTAGAAFAQDPDLRPERERADAVLRKIAGETREQVDIEVVRWEQSHYTATSTFQDQIPRPSQCDLVVFLFWKRLGSELPPAYDRPDGTSRTGTEFEFEDAVAGALKSERKIPDILVYRKTAPVIFHEQTVDLERADKRALDAFWAKWFRNEKGQFTAAFKTFGSTDEFAIVFENDLRSWLSGRSDRVAWTAGSPFPGLAAFDEDRTAVFFGRRTAVELGRARLVAAAADGCAFLLILGGSGSGKSSLVKAGLVPRLMQPSAVPMFDRFRRIVVTPAGLGDDPFTGLASALARADVLPEIAQGDYASTPALGRLLASGTANATVPIEAALRRVGHSVMQQEGRASLPSIALLLVLDQMEEIFGWTEETQTAFVLLLKAFARSGFIWIVGTFRSDLYERMQKIPELIALKEAGRTLDLAPPSGADIREIILRPAEAAGLSYEVSDDGMRDLAHILEAEAMRPGALPMLAFALQRLYEMRDPEAGRLLLTAYDEMGGAAGALAKHGDAAVALLDPEARDSFPAIVRRMVGVSAAGVPIALSPLLSEFPEGSPSRRLVDAMRDARLFTSHAGAGVTSSARVRVAHEALFEHWPILQAHIAADRRDLETRDRIAQAQELWHQASPQHRQDRLLSGLPLSESEDLLQRWSGDLAPDLAEFVRESTARARRLRNRTRAAIAAVVVILAASTATAVIFAIHATDQTREARAQSELARQQRDNALAGLIWSQFESTGDDPRAYEVDALWSLVAAEPSLFKAFWAQIADNPGHIAKLEKRSDMLARTTGLRGSERAEIATVPVLEAISASSDPYRLWPLAMFLKLLPVEVTAEQASALDPVIELYAPGGSRESRPDRELIMLLRVAAALAPNFTPAQAASVLDTIIKYAPRTKDGAPAQDFVQATVQKNMLRGTLHEAAGALAARLTREQGTVVLDSIIAAFHSPQKANDWIADRRITASIVNGLSASLTSAQRADVLKLMSGRWNPFDQKDVIQVFGSKLRLEQAEILELIPSIRKNAGWVLVAFLEMVGPGLSPEHGAEVLAALFEDLRNTSESDFFEFARMLRMIPGELTAEQVAILDAIIERRQQATAARKWSPELLRSWAAAATALAPKLTHQQAITVYGIVAEGCRADRRALSFSSAAVAAAQAVQALADKLMSEQVADAVAILESINISNDASIPPAVARAMEALAPRLAGEQAVSAFRKIVAWTSDDRSGSGHEALVRAAWAAAARLTSAQAFDELRRTMVERVLSGDFNWNAQMAKAEAAQALTALLSTEQAAIVLDSVLERFRNRLARKHLGLAVVAFAAKLPPDRISEFALLIASGIRNRDADESSAMALAAWALAPRLSSQQAAAALDSVMERMHDPLLPRKANELIRAVQALVPRLDAEQAEKAAPIARAGLANAERKVAAAAWARLINELLQSQPEARQLAQVIEALKYPTAAGEPTAVLISGLRKRFDSLPPQAADLRAIVGWIKARAPALDVDKPPTRPPAMALGSPVSPYLR